MFKCVRSAGLALTLAWGASSCALAQVVVVVGPGSSIGPISKEQVADIYLGRVQELPGGGRALLLTFPSGATREEFFTKVLGKTDSQARAIWARLTFTGSGAPPREVPDVAEMKRMLNANPNAIGYVEKSAVDAQLKVILTP